jgi:hypothetical protein
VAAFPGIERVPLVGRLGGIILAAQQRTFVRRLNFSSF